MKTQQAIIAEIHHSFDTAQDRLLAEALRILSDGEKVQPQLKKSDRLKSLGFENAATVQAYQEKGEVLVSTTKQAERIKYYKNAYPFLKFLTESELDRICNKYGLIYMSVDNFIGDVPDKNIAEIEKAQTRKGDDEPKDKLWCTLTRDNSFAILPTTPWLNIWEKDFYRVPKRIEGENFRDQYRANEYLREHFGFKKEYLVETVTNFKQDRSGLFICAPKSQFKGQDKSISKVEVQDPIVFRYVKGGIQVLTKWGLEASDQSLVVDQLN